ncbi:glycosyltransferase family 4 protein [Fontivita pretiosa]|uniref:glycosyltransferase family 4 protein n=1 Tax=Fontivita pretiosa TaxID=2989684 RepID=UPI003D16FADA
MNNSDRIEDAVTRPAVAIIANAVTPYRLHLHRRIVREIPQIALNSVFTHDISNSPWAAATPAEISPVMFGQGESCAQQDDPRYLLHEWRKGGRIIRWLREHRVRAVVLLGYNDLGRVRILLWCHRHHVPVLLWGDSNIRCEPTGGARAALKKLLLTPVVRCSDAIMPCGTLGTQFFHRYGGEDKPVFLMPYEPDYELIAAIDSSEADQVCQRMGLRPGRRRIVYSGRMIGIKRVDLLIDAFARIAHERPQWDLLLIGGGELKDALVARVPQELRHRTTWTGFLDDQRTVAALYRASDVLVLPSDFEPWAVVINEAAAAGLAIVASDVVGAAAELVRDGVNGFTFPKGDLEQLTQRLREVTDPARIDTLKAASPRVLAEWRQRADPVEGLRRALIWCGVLPADAATAAEHVRDPVVPAAAPQASPGTDLT